MKTFIGTGVGQPEAAVHQAVQGLTSPSAILFMASYEHFKETASRLKELFPDTPCIGTIGTRLVNGQVSDSGLAVLGFFSDVKIRCGILTEASRCPVAEVQRQGGRIGVYTVKLMDENQRVLVTADFTYYRTGQAIDQQG